MKTLHTESSLKCLLSICLHEYEMHDPADRGLLEGQCKSFLLLGLLPGQYLANYVEQDVKVVFWEELY